MSDSVGIGFPAQNLQAGHEHYDLLINGIYRYLGGSPVATVENWLLVEGELAGHPDTTEWGNRQAGARWFNKALGHFYGWDGAQIVQLSSEIV